MPKAFVDTNVLFYAVDERETVKRETASTLLQKLAESGDGVISIQVAHEFANNLVRKLAFTPAEAQTLCKGLNDLVIAPTSLDSVTEALAIMSTASISYWDASIVAAAARANCRILYTEDLQHGQVIAGVRVVNPFL